MSSDHSCYLISVCGGVNIMLDTLGVRVPIAVRAAVSLVSRYKEKKRQYLLLGAQNLSGRDHPPPLRFQLTY